MAYHCDGGRLYNTLYRLFSSRDPVYLSKGSYYAAKPTETQFQVYVINY